MKNNMKKIITGILSLSLLFTVNSVFASSIWNTASNDCKIIAIANYTTNTGYTNPCWTRSTVNADTGDSINIRVYYHNTSSRSATNTKVILNTSSSSSTSHSFSGYITSDQGSLSFGSVNVNLRATQKLTFSSARWYPNQTQTRASFLYGQDGSEVMNGGLKIGTIEKGWSTQGSVVIAFKVTEDIITPTYDCTISSFTVSGSSSKTITSGNSVDLAWSTNDCSNVSISGVGSNLLSNGNITVYPTTTTTYELTGNGSNAGYGILNPSRSVVVFVNASSNYNNSNYNCSISNFTTNQNYINRYSSATLNWNTSNCSSVNISDIGNVNNYGSQQVYPIYSTRYTLTAHGSNGSTQTRSVYITVNSNYYNNYNNSYTPECYISSFSSNRTQVNSGSPVTIIWNTNNCNNIYISNIGNLSTSGSKIVYPTDSTTYTLSASGYHTSTKTRSVYISINNNRPAYIVYNSCAVTTVATNINKNGATLNGLITSSNNLNNNYFEYGKTVKFGHTTNQRVTSGNVSFSNIITGLTPNTIYYFRVVSDCQGGINKGTTRIFQTASGSSPVKIISQNKKTTKVTAQGSTFSESTSSVMLKIENRYKEIDTEDIVEYTITYKNLGKETLANSVLQVTVPKGITITNTSRGTYSKETKTLTAELQDIKTGEEGVIYVQAQVSSLLPNTSQVVSTAVLVYTNKNGAQENAVAYVLNTAKDTNSLLGAAALFGSFGNMGLIGFLLTIILILVIILIIRKYFYRPAVVATYK